LEPTACTIRYTTRSHSVPCSNITKQLHDTSIHNNLEPQFRGQPMLLAMLQPDVTDVTSHRVLIYKTGCYVNHVAVSCFCTHLFQIITWNLWCIIDYLEYLTHLLGLRWESSSNWGTTAIIYVFFICLWKPNSCCLMLYFINMLMAPWSQYCNRFIFKDLDNFV